MSVWFKRTVTAGQLTLLTVFALACLFGIRTVAPSTPPEHTAIEAYLKNEVGKFAVTQWYPAKPQADGDALAVRAKYCYYTAHCKGIETDRVFYLKDGRVVSVDSDW